MHADNITDLATLLERLLEKNGLLPQRDGVFDTKESMFRHLLGRLLEFETEVSIHVLTEEMNKRRPRHCVVPKMLQRCKTEQAKFDIGDTARFDRVQRAAEIFEAAKRRKQGARRGHDWHAKPR